MFVLVVVYLGDKSGEMQMFVYKTLCNMEKGEGAGASSPWVINDLKAAL